MPDFQAWASAHQHRFEDVLKRCCRKPDLRRSACTRRCATACWTAASACARCWPLPPASWRCAELKRVDIAAAAVELIHAYSLVHDDMPCMDDDVLRRGKPTCHVQYDEATALLVGDSLQSLAFQLLAEHSLSDNPASQLEMVKLLAVASGSRGMAGGQAIDLASVGKQLTLPELEFMHIHKTGALIRAADAARRALRRRRWMPRNWQGWIISASASAWRSRWWTMCWTPRRIPRRWARPPARMRTTTSRPMSRLLGVSAAREMAAELHAKRWNRLVGVRRRGAASARTGRLYRAAENIDVFIARHHQHPG